MKKQMNKVRNTIQNQKKRYLVLIVLIVIGVISGILFTRVLKEVDKNLVKEELTNFFNQIKDNKINYNNGLVNSITSNVLYTIGVWLLGISIIGLPIIIFLLFLKGFVLGFSVTSIISIYNWKGIVGAITYIFPHYIVSLLVSLVLTFYATSFSVKLFLSLFLKKEINFKEVMKRYVKVLVISIVILLVCSLFETFVTPFLIKLFTSMI